MKKFVLAALIAASATSAFAADLPPIITKGPQLFAFESSGWYIGVEAGAAVAKSNVGGNSTLFVNSLVNGNLTAAGGTIGGCVGWLKGKHDSWWGVHGCVDYQNITAGVVGNNVSAGIASRWSATQEVRFGGSIIAWFTNILPNLGVTGLTFPSFSPPSGAGILAAAPRTYWALGVTEIGVSGNFNDASGATVQVGPLVKAGAIWQSLDTAGRPTGGAVDAFAQVSFMGKGFSYNTGSGATSGAANVGTIYRAGASYMFAVPSIVR